MFLLPDFFASARAMTGAERDDPITPEEIARDAARHDALLRQLAGDTSEPDVRDARQAA